MRFRLLAAGLLLAVVCRVTPASGDDVADEADLQFQLGAEAYQRGIYREALQHFLASNRLVKNRNVVFNIARSYEKLGLFPEAFRYYSDAEQGEGDAAARGRIADALRKIKNHVAVLDIQSEPPGATLYINRKDLGSHGEAPRVLGVAPGSYTVIAELQGHEPERVVVTALAAGDVRRISVALRPILGELVIQGDRWSAVRLPDRPQVGCVVPCRLSLPPGRHRIQVTRENAKPAEYEVDVAARRTATLVARLEPLSGNLVVSTDEPGALLEVDGRPRGFTPAIVELPVGRHRIRVRLSGFRNLERDVDVEDDRQTRLDLQLMPLEEVTAASRVAESIEAAPSSVTLLPRRELTLLAYPTIVESLRGVRGVYVSDDRSYATVGFRGLERLGSYGNRVLVLVDDMPLNDNWIGSSYVGYDARVDLEDIDRIEVVRGPGSVVYGTNAFSGVINLVTRYRDLPPGAGVGVSVAGDGVGRLRVRSDARLGDDAGIWASAAVARGQGRDFRFPELVADTPPEVAGQARDVDGFHAATLQGRAYWQWLSAQWYFNTHTKHLPTGEYETLLGDPRTRQLDTRVALELRADPRLGRRAKLMSRAHWDLYRFHGDYARSASEGGVEVDTFRGSWLSVEQRLELTPAETWRVTLGGELQIHYEVEQQARDDSGPFLDDSRPFQVGAGYVSVDGAVSSRVRLSLGSRLDAYSTFGSSLNPRAALIFAPYGSGILKLMAGKAFRAPSIYELYYNDAGFTQIASPGLEPESMYSLEIEHTHRFSPTVSATAAVFRNTVTDLIVTEGNGDEADPLRYVNSDSPLASVGAEIELRRDFRQGWMLALSYSVQHSRFLAGTGLSELATLEQSEQHRKVESSPAHLAAVKGAVPVIGRQVMLASRLSAESGRYDRYERTGEPPQGRTRPFVIWDLVFTGVENRWGLNWAAGVYNAFDWRYSLPVSAEFRQRVVPQSGRTFLASGQVRF